METPTDKALEVLRESMVQMRHDAVEEIKDGMRECVHDLAGHIFEKYIVIDKQTQQPVNEENCDLMASISDSEWYQHEILELLKRNEDDALEQMAWIAEPEIAPDGCAPEERFVADSLDFPIPSTCFPVGSHQYIQGIEELGRTAVEQEDVLRKAFKYLQTMPNVVSQEIAAQEAQAISKVKHLIHTQWLREARKAQHVYTLLMRGRGNGMEDLATTMAQQQMAGIDMS
jgi:hypothetical protein